MKLHITHTTRYFYDTPVSYGLQQVRLTPLSSKHQTVSNWQVEISGAQHELSFQDQHQNHTMLLQANPGVKEISVKVTGEVETHSSNGIYGKIYGIAPLWHFTQNSPRTTAGKAVKKLSKCLSKKGNLVDNLHLLSKSILLAAPYNKNKTAFDTTAEEALNAGGGVCQDHAQIFIAAARLAGVPARYVSGYLLMNGRTEQEASHAWAEAYIDSLGWVGFDVSNGISPDERYVRIATGLDSRDAAPITGVRVGSSSVESMIVSLQIQQ